jgi:hypothetical protein
MTQLGLLGVVGSRWEADLVVASLLRSGARAQDVSIVLCGSRVARAPRALVRDCEGVVSFVVADLGFIFAAGRAAVAFAATRSFERGLEQLGLPPASAHDCRVQVARGGIAIGVGANETCGRSGARLLLANSTVSWVRPEMPTPQVAETSSSVPPISCR